jgi:replicative DNA helicase
MFYQDGHALIYDAMLTLMDRHEPIDMLTVSDVLRRRDHLDKLGGSLYLAELMEMVPTAANAAHYARLIRDKAALRSVINLGSVLTTAAFEQEDVGGIMDRAQRAILEISNRQSMSSFADLEELLQGVIHQANHPPQDEITGVTTGFFDLDRMTSGLQRGDLIIIAARPSVGKTALAMQLAVNACAAHEALPVAVFSLEMSKEQLAMRLLCSEARVNSMAFRNGQLDSPDWGRIFDTSERIRTLPLMIDDTPRMSVLDIKARTKRLQIERGLGMIVIDYLQLLHSHQRSDSRQQEISAISRDLKIMAKEMNVPVVALSQLSRAVESREKKIPQLSDLRESGALEQDADVIGFIYREDVYDSNKPPVAKIIVAKQRNGPTGEVRLAFNKIFARFDNLAHDYPYPAASGG